VGVMRVLVCGGEGWVCVEWCTICLRLTLKDFLSKFEYFDILKNIRRSNRFYVKLRYYIPMSNEVIQ
jgi:hypothetical protein